MLQLKRLSINPLKFSIVLLVVSSAIFLGWGLANAASKTWTYGDYTRDCIDVYQVTDENGSTYWATADGTPVPDGYTVGATWNDDGTISGQMCGPEYYVTSATFNASTDKDTYNPGETVLVSVSGNNGSYGGGGWFCSTFGWGCGSAPAIGVGAIWNNQFVAQCNGSGSCSTSVPNAFTAPRTPGYYTIYLNGCTVSALYCSASSMEITVAEPATPPPPPPSGTPTVSLFFSFQ